MLRTMYLSVCVAWLICSKLEGAHYESKNKGTETLLTQQHKVNEINITMKTGARKLG